MLAQRAVPALTDADLRNADSFRNADGLIEVLTGLLAEAKQAGEITDAVDPAATASTLLALVLGLSLGTLLEQTPQDDVESMLRGYLDGTLGHEVQIMSDAAQPVERTGSPGLPRDLTEDELERAPVLESVDDLLIEDLTGVEADAFYAALDA